MLIERTKIYFDFQYSSFHIHLLLPGRYLLYIDEKFNLSGKNEWKNHTQPPHALNILAK